VREDVKKTGQKLNLLLISELQLAVTEPYLILAVMESMVIGSYSATD